MLPESGSILKQDFKIVQQPLKTFKVDIGNQRITEMVDGLEAIRQAVYCALNTERFEWLIFSWNYGVELDRLFGQSMGLVKSKLKKRIKEALMQDDRILSVDAFSFEVYGRKLLVKFTIHTSIGDINAEKEVSV
jgi:phage baseplate assembly protein W